MTRTANTILIAAAAALIATGSVAAAQGTGVIRGAKAEGDIGERSNGYLGIADSPDAEVRARVDAINIKRRAAYTAEAAKRGVTLEEWAAAVGCRTLAERVKDGQKYQLADGVWRTKSGPIALPASCG